MKPKPVKNPNDPENQLDDPSKSPMTVTLPGTCKSHMGWHKNGDEWHPIIASHGEQKCIKCRCKVSYMLYFSYAIIVVPDLVSCQSKHKINKPHVIDKNQYIYKFEMCYFCYLKNQLLSIC